MKQLFFAIACMCVSISMNAQGFMDQEANFNNWVDILDDAGNVKGQRPKGWHAPYNDYWISAGMPGEPGNIVLEPADSYTTEAGKSMKIIATNVNPNVATWHFSVKNMHWSTNTDYNEVFIDHGEDFYYTFWAKADAEGMKIWIGAEEIYNPGNGVNAWADMPSFELTTYWKQYGFVDYAIKDLTQFNIHPRMNGVMYVDDIVLEAGSELPTLHPGYPSAIFEIASDNNPISIISSYNGISFNSLEGTVSVFDIMGKQIVADKAVEQGNNFIPLAGKGMHIVKFKGQSEKAVKVVVM